MRVAQILSFGTFVASSAALPYVVHEERHVRTELRWSKTRQLDSSSVIPVRIGLKQQNLEHGDRWLMEVSDPASERYGKHWTAQEVKDAFKPSHETVKTVHDWLHNAGIHSSRHKLSEGLNWLEFDASVREAESLFRTTYHFFEHGLSATKHVACDNYSLPAHVTPHVDFVTPGVHFDSKTKPDTDLYLDANGSKIEKRRVMGPSSPWAGEICNVSFVTPQCLRLLYDVPAALPAVEGNSLGIVEYAPESYLESDLDLFFKTYDPAAVGERPIFDAIDGGYLYDNITNVTAFNYLGEPSLDLQYAMSLVYPQKVVLYQVGDLAESNLTSFNNFLDAIDASYCTYDGGDNSTEDAVYPDPYPGPGSYQGNQNCGTYAAAKVISTSYSYPNEQDLGAAYMARQCHEYMKLGLTGTTFAYSSGDYGVTDEGYCIAANGSYTDGSSGRFSASFPGNCPYVLSVGATQIRNGTYDVDAAIKAGEEVEVVMELTLTPEGSIGYDFPSGADPRGQIIFSSGGGFSDVFAMPSYQASAVTSYLDKYAPDYPGQYNNSGKARGYPDISANGAWFSIAVFGELSQVFGTSASTPTVASILTLLNGERIRAGKSTLGFVNPTLYAHPEIFNDITAGGNPGCGTYGFDAVAGWDPVTGLGTPNYPKMLELFLNLP
ncbi:hypothetical protein LTR85_007882 [Meristemomyces frigidus]|nr:hypothetical protein LTR85_007882 [Meristemomyces frigidus]